MAVEMISTPGISESNGLEKKSPPPETVAPRTEIAARLAFGDRRGVNGLRVGHVQLCFCYLKPPQPASGVNRSPNLAASTRKVDTTFSVPRVRA